MHTVASRAVLVRGVDLHAHALGTGEHLPPVLGLDYGVDELAEGHAVALGHLPLGRLAR